MIISFFRAEDLMFYSFRAPHVVSAILIVISVAALIFSKKKRSKKGKIC